MKKKRLSWKSYWTGMKRNQRWVNVFSIFQLVCSKQSFIYILHCFEVSYIFYGSVLFFFTNEKNHILNLLLFSIAIDVIKYNKGLATVMCAVVAQ